MAYLVLVRHGITEYNAKGLWTGWDDPDLTREGKQEAEKAAHKLQDITFDIAFVPDQKRARNTLSIILSKLGQTQVPIKEDKNIRERNYGEFTKRNKWEVKSELGDEEFLKLRRGWDYPISGGESLKQVYERSVPYFTQTILPYAKAGKNTLIVSGGNVLRSLIKYLNNIPDDDIINTEINTGEVLLYKITPDGIVLEK